MQTHIKFWLLGIVLLSSLGCAVYPAYPTVGVGVGYYGGGYYGPGPRYYGGWRGVPYGYGHYGFGRGGFGGGWRGHGWYGHGWHH